MTPILVIAGKKLWNALFAVKKAKNIKNRRMQKNVALVLHAREVVVDVPAVADYDGR